MLQGGSVTLSPVNAHSGAGYLGVTWKPLDRLELVPSLRVEYFSHLKQTVADPRLLAKLVVVPDTLTLKGGIGLYHQPPSLLQTESPIGNPDSTIMRPSGLSLRVGDP